MNKPPLRRIVEANFYTPSSAPRGTGSAELKLECGHTSSLKWSIYARGGKHMKKTRCIECWRSQ